MQQHNNFFWKASAKVAQQGEYDLKTSGWRGEEEEAQGGQRQAGIVL